MKALVYTGPESLEYRDETDPSANDEIVVAVEACGICGSDMHAYLGHDDRRPAPLVLGHEVCGIAQSGAHSGKRVTINPLVTCMECPACLEGRTNLCPSRQIISMMPRPGGFADCVSIPERNLLLVPDGLDPAIASLTEPIAVSYHGINLAEKALLRSPSASSAVVIGGGAIGVAAAAVLKSRGVHRLRVAETNPLRRSALEQSGQHEVFDPTTDETSLENTADLVVDAVGYEPTRALACQIARPGGVIVHVGLGSATGGVDVRKLTLQEITFIGAYTYTMTDFAETLDGLAAGRFGTIDWIEERPLSKGAPAFKELRAGTVAAAKIILRPVTDKSIIIIAHMPSANTRRLAEAVLDGALSPEIEGVSARLMSPFDANASDVLDANAVILGTTENLGYMSGALKDFFDRTYYDCLDKTDGKPMAAFIRAGLDGTGTKRAILSITGGLRWRAVQEPLVCTGAFQDQFVTECHDLGMAVAAGLEAGVF